MTPNPFCDIHDAKPFKCIGFRLAFISQTPGMGQNISEAEPTGGLPRVWPAAESNLSPTKQRAIPH